VQCQSAKRLICMGIFPLWGGAFTNNILANHADSLARRHVGKPTETSASAAKQSEAMPRDLQRQNLKMIGRLLRGAFRDSCIHQAAYTASQDANPFTSIGLPLGSRKNMVACSPGWPAKRTWGSSTKATLCCLRRSARAFQVVHQQDHTQVRHGHHVRADLAGVGGVEGLAQDGVRSGG